METGTALDRQSKQHRREMMAACIWAVAMEIECRAQDTDPLQGCVPHTVARVTSVDHDPHESTPISYRENPSLKFLWGEVAS